VAEGVVDLLETVEVDQQQRDFAADGLFPGYVAQKPAIEVHAVGETGDGVAIGQDLKPAILLLDVLIGDLERLGEIGRVQLGDLVADENAFGGEIALHHDDHQAQHIDRHDRRG